VNRLVKDKVILTKKVGKAIVCSLNPANDLTIALLHLNEVNKKENFYKKNKQIKLILEDFLNLVISEKLAFIVLFGSYAKETATKESDIDILIVADKKLEIAKIIRNIHAKYGKEIVSVLMSPKEFDEQKEKPVIKEIIKYHYILYGFERFLTKIL
jgi:predicted nucleotidyltransferase